MYFEINILSYAGLSVVNFFFFFKAFIKPLVESRDLIRVSKKVKVNPYLWHSVDEPSTHPCPGLSVCDAGHSFIARLL